MSIAACGSCVALALCGAALAAPQIGGYIHVVDRANTGLHVLKLTGEARRVANFPR